MTASCFLASRELTEVIELDLSASFMVLVPFGELFMTMSEKLCVSVRPIVLTDQRGSRRVAVRD